MPRLRLCFRRCSCSRSLAVACSSAPAPAPTAAPRSRGDQAGRGSQAGGLAGRRRSPARPTAPAASASPAASPRSPVAIAGRRARPRAAARRSRPRKRLRVGLVTDVGKVDDKSFNQSAWEGVQRAQRELGAEVKFVETTDPKDYAKNIDQFAQDNYDVIVTVGFALGQATEEAAKKYPNIKFIGVDQFQAKPIDNLAGLIFDEDKAGYLAGALAGLMTKSGTIGQVLGHRPGAAGREVRQGLRGRREGRQAGHQGADRRTTPAAWPRASPTRSGARRPPPQMIEQKADVDLRRRRQDRQRRAARRRRERNVLGIGVDTDQCETLPQVQAGPALQRDEADHAGRVRPDQGGQRGHVQGRQLVGRSAWRRSTTSTSKVPADGQGAARSRSTSGLRTARSRPASTAAAG